MKNIFSFICAALMLCLASTAFAILPQDYQEFKSRYQTEGRTAEGALKLHFEAIFSYINPQTRAEAGKMLRYSMHLPMPLEKSTHNALFISRMKDPRYNFVFRSFAKGTSPENNYRMSEDNFSLQIQSRFSSDGYLKLRLRSSGADNERIVWLRQYDDGLWYVENNNDLFFQVRPPQSQRKNPHAHDSDYDTYQ
jgi:hypothetical protein